MSTYNIEMNTYNGSTYDQLFPKTLLNNISDWSSNIYSKSEVNSIQSSLTETITSNNNELLSQIQNKKIIIDTILTVRLSATGSGNLIDVMQSFIVPKVSYDYFQITIYSNTRVNIYDRKSSNADSIINDDGKICLGIFCHPMKYAISQHDGGYEHNYAYMTYYNSNKLFSTTNNTTLYYTSGGSGYLYFYGMRV